MKYLYHTCRYNKYCTFNQIQIIEYITTRQPALGTCCNFFLNGKCWWVQKTELSPIGDNTGDNTGDNVVAICPGHCPTGDMIVDNF